MLRRRRTILIAGCVLAVVVGLAGWLGSRGGRAEVKIVFLGWTNDTVNFPGCSESGGPYTRILTAGRVAVTNTGSVSIQAVDFRSENVLLQSYGHSSAQVGRGDPSGLGLPDVLKPRESAEGTFWMIPGDTVYRHDIGFLRVGLRDRLSALCDRIGWDYGADKFSYEPNTNDLLWVSTGWITNTPVSR